MLTRHNSRCISLVPMEIFRLSVLKLSTDKITSVSLYIPKHKDCMCVLPVIEVSVNHPKAFHKGHMQNLASYIRKRSQKSNILHALPLLYRKCTVAYDAFQERQQQCNNTL